MKTFRKISAVIFTLVFMALVALPCLAVEEALVQDVNSEESAALLEQLNVTLIDEPKKTGDFTNFAVCENGDFVLCFTERAHDTVLGRLLGGNKKYDKILVYDENGTYLYGYALMVYGEMGVGFNPDNTIVVYITSGGYAVSIDMDGNCFDIQKLEGDTDISDNWRGYQKIVQGTVYTARHWYSDNLRMREEYQRLVKITPEGEEIVLFSANNHITFDEIIVIAWPVFVVLILLTGGLIALHVVEKKRKKARKQEAE